MVKSTNCSSKGPEFKSQQPHGMEKKKKKTDESHMCFRISMFPTCVPYAHAKHPLSHGEREKASSHSEDPSLLPLSPALVNPFALLATKEEPPQERPAVNQTLAEVITEQANLSVSAAHSSKVLYVITPSPSHPPQTAPGSHSWAPSVGANSHRVEGSSFNTYRNKGACGCFPCRHMLGYWPCNL